MPLYHNGGNVAHAKHDHSISEPSCRQSLDGAGPHRIWRITCKAN
jgi:hypothetical protein